MGRNEKFGVIFDLDQTLIDSSSAEKYRPGNWPKVYEMIPHFDAYPGIDEALQTIEEMNIPYCIVTSSPSHYCLKVCDHWNIKRDFTVCYHDTPRGEKKPHPAPILMALQKLGVAPSRALSFGDRDIDIIASNRAGVASVACLWGAADKVSLLAANPTYVIESPDEIISLIESIYK